MSGSLESLLSLSVLLMYRDPFPDGYYDPPTTINSADTS